MYVGQQYNLRARYYNSVVARFTKENTYQGDGLNLYTYLSQTLIETDGNGNLIAAYTRADTLLSQTRDDETSYYLYDGHGDVRALLNEAGRITDKYRYNAYGELLEQTGDTENHYLYTGEYYDGISNLYYLRARYMNPSTGTFISMDTYEGSIYDPDTLHKYLYANGNPVTYSDPSGNMFDFSSTTLATGIQSILNNAVQISYRGVMCGLINMTLTAVMGGSWEQAKSSFITGFFLGAGISAVRYFAVGAELVTLARFYVLSASANFIFSTTVTIFAITQGYSDMAVMFGVMAVLSIAEWCWAYGNYLLIDVYGNKGCATIECDPGGGSEGESVTRGILTGSLDGLTADERAMVNDLLNQGKDIEIIPRSNVPNNKTPDFFVDGVKTELKTLNGTSLNTPVTRVQDGFNQGAETVIIDGRKTGMTLEQANEVIERATGVYGGTLPGSVEIWTKEGIVRR